MATKATCIDWLLAQARNAVGTLAGGTITVYEAGTVTLATIWTDRDKNSEAANPYDIDANGTAQLYADGLIKVVIKNSTGSTVYTRDYLNYVDYLTSGAYQAIDADYASLNAAISAIGAIPTTLLIRTAGFSTTGDYIVPATLSIKIEYPGSIANSTNAGTFNGPFSAPRTQVFTGTGAVVLNKAEYINPLWWTTNTTPGTTDMTTAIQAAHDCAAASAYQPVVFDAGQYKFSTLTWSPHVSAIARGKVYLETANGSGRTLQVSDEYGRPATYGLNAPRNIIFSGQFYLKNTNAANTATAWSFGGSSASYYCNIVTALNGVETRSFHGGVYEFRNNAFLIDFENCFDYGCNGNRIVIADPVTNTGEGIRFINTVFGSGDSYLMDVNTVHVMTFNFIGCSADYLLGLNATGNSAPLLSVSWQGGHMEWDTVAAAFLQNDSASTWNVDGTAVVPTATVGWPTYLVSVTTGAGTTRFTNIKYVIPGAVDTLHQLVSSTSKGVFDYSPNYQGGNTPSGLVTYHADAIVGYDGITYRELNSPSYVPTWSGTLGNGTLVGKYTRIGNRVDVSIKLTWGTTTSHAAANQTFVLPYTANATYPGIGSWYALDAGTGNRTGTAMVAPSGTALTLYNDATAGQVTDAVPMTWTTSDTISIFITYFL